MKQPISTLVTFAFMSLSAWAAPMLCIETSLSDHDAQGEPSVLAKPRVIVESGKRASIRFGNLEYSLTPTLHDRGTVEIETVITEHTGEKARTLSKPRVVVELGKSGEIRFGQRTLTLQPSLSK